ncbi:MAG: hypothetical protein ABJB12_11485 [Pseudomonadota bacterium]
MSRRSKPANGKSDKSGARDRPRAARRPQAPLPEVMLARRPASVPAVALPDPALSTPEARPALPQQPFVPVKRAARIITGAAPVDDTELERRHLLARLLDCVGPAAVTRAAKAYLNGGFSFPEEQAVQLKLLEHSDEAEVARALEVLTKLLDQQAPVQLPIFEQRLKRLEEGAESAETRERAAQLRRVLRT